MTTTETPTKFEQSAAVYSVVRIKADEQARLQPYLYDHTTIEALPGYDGEPNADGLVPVILKTTATAEVTLGVESVCADSVKLADRAFFLANYQLDRLASGLIIGEIAGTRFAAERIAVEVLTYER